MRKFIIPSIFLLALTFLGCEEKEIGIEYPCLKGEVLGKIRSAGGGLAVELDTEIDGTSIWKDRDNVIEVLNIPVAYTVPGTEIYFSARKIREGEQGPITNDGNETIKLILFGKQFSQEGCIDLND